MTAPKNIELLPQIVISVNEFSNYGVVTEMCDVTSSLVSFGNLLLHKCKPMKSNKETSCKNMTNDLENCQKTRNYLNYALKHV